MAAKKISKVTKRAIQIFPDRSWVKEQKSKLSRRIPPYQLKGVAPESINEKTISGIREHANHQLDALLAALGLERTTPNVWERAFFLIAVVEYGVGRITWTPPRGPNQHAEKWTKLDKELRHDVCHLTEQGLSEIQALEIIAKDPDKCKKFGLKSDATSEKPDWKRHVQTLKKRLNHIKKMPLGLLQALGHDPGEADFASLLAAWKEAGPRLRSAKIKLRKKSSS